MRRFTVIGAGSFGYYAAKALYENKNEVIVIDRSKDRIQAIDPFCTSAIVQDATDIEALKGLGLEEMDAVIVSTGANITPSILICFHLNRLEIKQIIVKAEDDDHGEILKQLGATEVIRPGMDMAGRLALRLTSPNILEFLPLAEGYTIAQVEPPKPFVGKSLMELELRKRYQVNVIAVKEQFPERFIMVPGADFIVKESDILVTLGKEKNLSKIRELK
ncbi:potassium channel family protein [Desulfotignum balticum]|jgi:trk system potassium uptake protein TrkA|uniref:potassium channel family protein n=1 Tax=Desulfotignum balticum TaxID=115781 RepID=UPI000400EE70|nr:TrkA family potassium uptake protein [Desulfotignum balticum]